MNSARAQNEFTKLAEGFPSQRQSQSTAEEVYWKKNTRKEKTQDRKNLGLRKFMLLKMQTTTKTDNFVKQQKMNWNSKFNNFVNLDAISKKICILKLNLMFKVSATVIANIQFEIPIELKLCDSKWGKRLFRANKKVKSFTQVRSQLSSTLYTFSSNSIRAHNKTTRKDHYGKFRAIIFTFLKIILLL